MKQAQPRPLPVAASANGDESAPPREAPPLQELLAEVIQQRAEWRAALRALIDEDTRLEQQEEAILSTAVQQAELARAGGTARGDLRSLLDAYERLLIESALATAGGRQTRAALALGVRPTSLNEKMKRLGIGSR